MHVKTEMNESIRLRIQVIETAVHASIEFDRRKRTFRIFDQFIHTYVFFKGPIDDPVPASIAKGSGSSQIRTSAVSY